MNENPTYRIHGKERRVLKKELGELKRFIKNFWYYRQLDKDMSHFYGGSENYPMSDEDAQKVYDKNCIKIQNLEYLLSIPY